MFSLLTLYGLRKQPIKIPVMLQGMQVSVEITDYHCIACGGYGNIYKGLLMKESGHTETVAVKVLRGTPAEAEVLIRRISREAAVWSSAMHPYITPFLGISYDSEGSNMPSLITKFYENGNVMAYLKNRSRVDKMVIITQIAEGLAYLHSRFIIHGDIKGDNILINDKGQACLADFGQARILQASGFTTNTQSGTWRYMAPELLASEEELVIEKVTTASDVYAFAMTVVEIFTGRAPFSHIRNDAKVVMEVLIGRRPAREDCEQIDDSLWLILEKSWNPDPVQRPSMASIFSRLQRKTAIR